MRIMTVTVQWSLVMGEEAHEGSCGLMMLAMEAVNVDVMVKVLKR